MKCLSFVSSLSVTPLYPYDLVLKERMGFGWIPLLIGSILRARLSPVFSLVLQLCQPWVTNDMFLTTPLDLSWGPPAPAKQKLPYHFYRNFNPVKNSFVMWSFIGKGNVLRIFYSSACYESSLLLSDTHSDFWPPWWSWLSHVELWFPAQVLNSEFSFILVDVFHIFNFILFFSQPFVKRKGILFEDDSSFCHRLMKPSPNRIPPSKTILEEPMCPWRNLCTEQRVGAWEKPRFCCQIFSHEPTELRK